MARFDVYELNGTHGLVVDCQSNLLNHFNTRFVAPLLPESGAPPPLPRLTPTFEIDGKRFMMATHLAASIPVKAIKRTIASLKEDDAKIIHALDTLITEA